MNDEYQSTNEIIGLNNQSFHILWRDNVTITPESTTVGYQGSAQINIDHILATVANPEFDVYEYRELGAPGYQKELIKTPTTLIDYSSGDVDFVSNSYLYWDMGKTGVSVVIFFWHRTDDTPRTFYLNVRGTSITNGNVFTP